MTAQSMSEGQDRRDLHSNDEIDLVAVGIALWKRRKLMAAVFFACIVGGVLLAIILPRNYDYFTTISLGNYVKANGSVAPYVSAGAAAFDLNNGLIQMAIRQYTASHSMDPRRIKIVASAGPGSTVLISGNSPKSLGVAYMSIERRLPALLTKNILPRIKILHSRLRQELALNRVLVPLAFLDNEQGKRLKSRKGRIETARQELAESQPIQTVAPPSRSIRPTGGLTRITIIFLGIVLGIIFAPIAGAFANYIAAIRRRLITQDG